MYFNECHEWHISVSGDTDVGRHVTENVRLSVLNRPVHMEGAPEEQVKLNVRV